VREIDASWVALAGFLLLTAGVLVVGAGTSDATFSPHNPAWDGSAEFRATADDGATLRYADETTRYDEVRADGTVAFVLSPERAYGPADVARVQSFVERGGTLVVAEDFGPHGNALLDGVGADARVDGRPLRDERSNYRSPAVPRATDVAAHPLTDGADHVTLNYGTPVRPNGADVLVATSGFAYIDENRDGTLNDDERLDSRPVVTVESVGEGRVVVVGDPSVFINRMVTTGGNRPFVRALTADAGTVLLDDSTADRLPARVTWRLALRRSPLAGAALGSAAVLLLFAVAEGSLGWLRRRDRRDATDVRPDPAALAAVVTERHPDWDPGRVRRIAQGLISRTDERESDE